jgi:hypothetical protein
MIAAIATVFAMHQIFTASTATNRFMTVTTMRTSSKPTVAIRNSKKHHPDTNNNRVETTTSKAAPAASTPPPPSVDDDDASDQVTATADPTTLKKKSKNPQQQQEEETKRWEKYHTRYNYSAPFGETNSSSLPRAPAKQCGQGPDFQEFFDLFDLKERSRLNEDKTIYNLFFKDKMKQHNGKNGSSTFTTGTYVELGAYDGKQESNTRFFDLCLGWKGLLIEGNPMTFSKALQARPHAHLMSFAPSCAVDNGTMVQFSPFPFTNTGLRGYAKAYDKEPSIDVPCGPLGPVLEDIFGHQQEADNGDDVEVPMPRINFFSLDVEGSEPLVLRTIDFDKIWIDVLMVEVENVFCPPVENCTARDDTRSIMAQAGYQRYEGLIPASDVYVHPQSEFALPPEVKASSSK